MAERREHGEGSVYQRSSHGRWVGVVTLGYDERGKRRRQVVYGERQSDVIAKLRKVQRQVDDGLPTPDSRVTVAQLLDR